MNQEERRRFVREHRSCVFGYERKQGTPSMSIVYYVMDGDDMLVSTMAGRAKARAVHRNPEVSLCVLDEQWPPTPLCGRRRFQARPRPRTEPALALNRRFAPSAADEAGSQRRSI